MPIAATTLPALRLAIQQRIEGTTSDHTRTSEHPWRRLTKVDDVAGSQRGYYLEIANQRRRLEGGLFTSSWATYDADLKIWTGYHGLTDEHWEDAMSADMRQLLVRLSNVTGQITGLIGIMDGLPWEDGESSGRDARWGAHVFKITYLLEQP